MTEAAATADALVASGEFARAIDANTEALRSGSGGAALHHTLGRALYEMGEVSRAASHFEAAAAASGRLEHHLALATVVPADPAATPLRILDVRRALASRLASVGHAARAEAHRARPLHGRRLRVGFVSAWFDHANYMRPVWALLAHLDRASFDVHLFSDTLPADMAGFAPPAGDTTHWTGWLDNGQLASLIRSRGIDVLVDLNGYSTPGRLPLFLEAAAPVTIGWFNHFATSGLPGIHWLIGDREVVAPPEESAFSERIVRLPVSYRTFDPGPGAPPVAPPPCARDGALTFGSLATQYKIGPAVLDTWASILRRTRHTRLLVANRALDSADNRAYLANRFAERGIDAGRLVLLGPADPLPFLRYYDRIDIALDPFPYSGGTTTIEALWQGVPVLTVAGDRWAARTTRSLLHHAGRDDLVARDAVALEELAVSLASDPFVCTRLERWRASQRERLLSASVCNGASLARHIGRVFATLGRHAAGNPAGASV